MKTVTAAKTTKKSNFGKKIVDQITGIFLPIINTITAASIIKSVIVLLATFGVLSVDSGIYKVFYAVSDGFFYFLPFFIAHTTSKQWKTDPFISMLIPIALLYPDITATLEGGIGMDFLGLPVPGIVYHSSVLPVIMALGLLYFLEKPCDKFIHESVRGFLKPIICCVIILPITFLVFGPLGNIIGDFLTNVFFALYNWNSIVAGAFMGFFIQPMVVVGAHWSVVPVCINNIATNGYDVILPLLGGAVYGQAGAALAVGLYHKKNKEKRRIAFQASLAAILGVTEPALFGVNVPNIRAMISACIAGALGGALVGYAGTHCNSFAFPSFLTSVAYVGPGFALFLVSMVIGFITGFVLALLMCKGKVDDGVEKE